MAKQTLRRKKHKKSRRLQRKSLGLQRKSLGLQRKSLGLQRKSRGLQRKSRRLDKMHGLDKSRRLQRKSRRLDKSRRIGLQRKSRIQRGGVLKKIELYTDLMLELLDECYARYDLHDDSQLIGYIKGFFGTPRNFIKYIKARMAQEKNESVSLGELITQSDYNDSRFAFSNFKLDQQQKNWIDFIMSLQRSIDNMFSSNIDIASEVLRRELTNPKDIAYLRDYINRLKEGDGLGRNALHKALDRMIKTKNVQTTRPSHFLKDIIAQVEHDYPIAATATATEATARPAAEAATEAGAAEAGEAGEAGAGAATARPAAESTARPDPRTVPEKTNRNTWFKNPATYQTKIQTNCEILNRILPKYTRRDTLYHQQRVKFLCNFAKTINNIELLISIHDELKNIKTEYIS